MLHARGVQRPCLRACPLALCKLACRLAVRCHLVPPTAVACPSLPFPSAPADGQSLTEESAQVEDELAEAEAKNRLYVMLLERTRREHMAVDQQVGPPSPAPGFCAAKSGVPGALGRAPLAFQWHCQALRQEATCIALPCPALRFRCATSRSPSATAQKTCITWGSTSTRRARQRSLRSAS